MRCPECVQRNSVAARKCQFCGAKFPKKSKSVPIKLIGAILLVGLLVGVVWNVLPKMVSSGNELEEIANSINSGPESTEHAQKLKVKLDKAILGFLKDNSELSSGELLTSLQAKLPTSIFEVLVFDLPNKTKLVEVDCVLQPSDFLVVGADKGSKVTQIFGLDVFDEGRLVKTEAGPYLILVGHTNVDMKKRPNVKAINLQPSGAAIDQTNKMVPVVRGEGSIKFAKNNRDILLERNLLSAALQEEMFKGDLKFADQPYKTTLKWKNGKYEAIHSLGHHQLSALYAVASSLIEPEDVANYKSYLDAPVVDFVKSIDEKPVVSPPGFTVKKTSEKTTKPRRRRGSSRTMVGYTIASQAPTRAFDLVLAGQDGQKWTIASIKEVSPPAPAKETESLASESKDENAPIVVKTKEAELKVENRKVEIAPKVVKKKEEPKKVASVPKPEPKKPAKLPPKKVETNLPGIKSIVSSRGVTVRSGPSTRNRKVTTVRKGQTVKVIGKENGWYRIVVNGKKGYVWSGLVDYKKSDGYTTAIVRKKKAVRDSRKRTVSTTNPGDKLVLLGGLKNNKYKVRLANGKIGYVEKDAIDVAVEEPAFVP